MKPKHFFAFMLTAVLLGVTFTSCSSDDDPTDPDKQSIAGTYVYEYYDSYDGYVTETLKFESDNKVVNTYSCTLQPDYNFSVTL